jgi:site-specific recombinase XerD
MSASAEGLVSTFLDMLAAERDAAANTIQAAS